MNNLDRIKSLEAWRISADRRIDNLIVRVEALESAVTLTDMGWATAEPEPVASPWQPIETVPLGKVWVSRGGKLSGSREVDVVHVENFIRNHTYTHWAPLPAPPTEPAPSPTVPRQCWICGATDGNHVGLAEPAPEPSPDKAERVGPEWTAEYAAKVIRREADDLMRLGRDWRSTKVVNIGPGLTAIVERLRDHADQIAAALNSTPDPLLVGLVDACREVLWLFDDDGHQRPGERRLTARNIKNLRATYDAYLAEQEGER